MKKMATLEEIVELAENEEAVEFDEFDPEAQPPGTALGRVVYEGQEYCFKAFRDFPLTKTNCSIWWQPPPDIPDQLQNFLSQVTHLRILERELKQGISELLQGKKIEELRPEEITGLRGKKEDSQIFEALRGPRKSFLQFLASGAASDFIFSLRMRSLYKKAARQS